MPWSNYTLQGTLQMSMLTHWQPISFIWGIRKYTEQGLKSISECFCTSEHAGKQQVHTTKQLNYSTLSSQKSLVRQHCTSGHFGGSYVPYCNPQRSLQQTASRWWQNSTFMIEGITGTLLPLSLPEVSHAAWHTALHLFHSELWLTP